MAIDKPQARELSLFIENDGTLYRQITTPIVNNYAKKKVKGTFNKSSGIKGLLILVEAGRRKYIKDFGGIGGQVSKETKIEVAKQLFPMINEESTFEAKRLKKLTNAKKKLKKITKKKK